MLPYVALFSFTAILGFLSLDRHKILTLFIPFLSALLILFVGLRYNSVDYANYRDIFNYINYYSELSFPNYVPSGGQKSIESLYSLLALVVKSAGGGYYGFIFFVSFISLSIKFYCFKKMSSAFYVSLLLYVSAYMANDMGQIRNGLSSGLTLLGVYFLCRAKPLLTAVALSSAVFVHLTAILSFLIYIVHFFSRQLVMWTFLLFFFVTAAAGGLGMKLVELLVSAIGLGAEFRIVRYMSSEYAEAYSIFGGTIILHMFVAVMAIVFKRRLIRVNSYNRLIIPIYVYGFCLMMFFIDYGIVLARVKDLFCLPASMILIPSFIFMFKGYSKLVVYFAIVAYALLLFIFYKPGLPYESVLFN